MGREKKRKKKIASAPKQTIPRPDAKIISRLDGCLTRKGKSGGPEGGRQAGRKNGMGANQAPIKTREE